MTRSGRKFKPELTMEECIAEMMHLLLEDRKCRDDELIEECRQQEEQLRMFRSFLETSRSQEPVETEGAVPAVRGDDRFKLT